MNNEVTEVNAENKVSRVTLSTLIGTLKRFVVVILIATVLMASLSFAYVSFLTTETYSASAKFYVSNQAQSSATMDNSTLSAASNVTADCVELIKVSDTMMSNIVDDKELDKVLGMDAQSAKNYIKSHVSASKSGEDSRIFVITVNTPNKAHTAEIITALKESVPSELVSVLKPDESALNLKISSLEPEINVYPVKDSPFSAAVLGGAAAFVVSFIVCFFIFINDTKVYDDSTIKEHFTSPVIGVIPEWNIPGEDGTSVRNNKRSMLSGDKRNYKGKLLTSSTPFGVTEAFNTLRTNLCYATVANKCPVFAITSDFSGVGKSVISANVAASFAMLGKKTLLIECDLRRPELSQVFDVENGIGLSELLSGVATNRDEIMRSAGYDNLDVVFSGRIPPNPSELLGSETMASFIKECRESYDIIIVDTPPAYEVSDIGVISSLLTGTVMVARCNYSDINAISSAEELINGVNGRVIGYVVNDVEYKSGAGYGKNKYGYRGYRKYARYYSSYETKSDNTDRK